MSSKKSVCKSQMCWGSSLSRKWRRSRRVKKALQPRAKCRPVSSKSLSIRVLWGELWEVNTKGYLDIYHATYVPHMNEARFGPRYIIIQVQRSTFSDPLSPRMRDGQPYVLIMSRNSLRTVCAVLLVDTLCQRYNFQFLKFSHFSRFLHAHYALMYFSIILFTYPKLLSVLVDPL